MFSNLKPTGPASKLLWYTAKETFGNYFVHATGVSRIFKRIIDATYPKI
jgi:hypothetical protein